MEKKISKQTALECLEDLDDFSRMTMGVNPIGPYKALKAFIEQQPDVNENKEFSNHDKLVRATAIVEKYYPERGNPTFTWAIQAVMEALENPNAGK